MLVWPFHSANTSVLYKSITDLRNKVKQLSEKLIQALRAKKKLVRRAVQASFPASVRTLLTRGRVSVLLVVGCRSMLPRPTPGKHSVVCAAPSHRHLCKRRHSWRPNRRQRSSRLASRQHLNLATRVVGVAWQRPQRSRDRRVAPWGLLLCVRVPVAWTVLTLAPAPALATCHLRPTS